jgi:hypothetical protein
VWHQSVHPWLWLRDPYIPIFAVMDQWYKKHPKLLDKQHNLHAKMRQSLHPAHVSRRGLRHHNPLAAQYYHNSNNYMQIG